VLILWKRWGSAPDHAKNTPYTSGTQEEYHFAKARYDDRRLQDIAVFFKSADPAQMSDPDPQLQSVLEFRRELESSYELLYHVFDQTRDFERMLRRLLGQWRRDHENGKAAKARRSPPRMPPPSDEIPVPRSESPNAKALAEAWRYAEEGKLTDAETLFARSVVRGSDPEALRSYGAFLLRAGRRKQAAVMFDCILDLTSDADRIWRALAYGNLGLIRDLSGDFDGAEELHKKSLAIHEKLGRCDGMAYVQNNLGILAKRRGGLEEAESLYRLALANARAAQRKDIEGRAYNNLGLLFRDKGDHRNSELMFQRALALAEERGKAQETATALVNFGFLEVDRDRWNIAEGMLSRALAISRQLGFRECTAQASVGLGALRLKQGRPEDANSLFADALQISTETQRSDGIANAAVNLAVVAANRGDLEAAERFLMSALEAYTEIGEPLGQATVEENLGEVVRVRGEIERARRLWQQARRRLEEQGLTIRADRISERLRAL
jgi:tetratricopeptide (TPR) repeat protein